MTELFMVAYLLIGLLLEVRMYRRLLDEHVAGRPLATVELAALIGTLFGWPILLTFELCSRTSE